MLLHFVTCTRIQSGFVVRFSFAPQVDEEEESDYFADFDSTGTNEDVISDEEIDAQAARPSKSIRLPKIKRHTALDIERAEVGGRRAHF